MGDFNGKVGFVGLGNVGSKLAGSLLRNGVDLCVHDFNRELVDSFVEKGAGSVSGPAEMMRRCDVVITCLPSPAASTAVVTEMLPHVTRGKTWVEMSTTDEEELRRLAGLVAEAGGNTAECPVSGGCHRADTGNLSIFAGCDSRGVFEEVLPLLTVLGRRVLHTGPIGSASKLKVMTNYLGTVNLVSCCEAMTTMKAAGVDMATCYEAMKMSSGTSFVHETESQLILSGSRNVNFTMDLVLKDIGLFQKLADQHGVPLEVSPLVIDIMKDGQKRFGHRAQSDRIIERLEEATQLSIRAEGFPTELIDDEPEERGYEVKVTRGAG
uniref:3-hydroxyisobutyrate dehydrogenase n=1 Tax=Chromera velia CCMP2878 TaxID=1169474 RepID=A0A0G4GJX3_9ALVE|eukprot:Cvel_22217.t1-p1 / transcript=Cvel_22217.t1 / gene=Cvel_22217 / organism=Chromera_velia_CCMP2878 / gene_product=2-(hydroxymethyl)glutarate dehydrogenase, putative / transcript_product=2-(hydroxymethyl)glutarate dehydrogenase, putative / location=Cvel_scaffold2160:28196-29164(-) / protein_length=323 / sequence_SO=supercontig / SO=protein_coding / is_pseudo=false